MEQQKRTTISVALSDEEIEKVRRVASIAAGNTMHRVLAEILKAGIEVAGADPIGVAQRLPSPFRGGK